MAFRLAALVATLAVPAAEATLSSSSPSYSIHNELQLIDPHAIHVGPGGGPATGAADFSISLSTAGPIENNEPVVITVAASGAPAAGDWLAMYSPFPADVTQVVPVKWQYLAFDAGYLGSGTARLRFMLTNMRASVGFCVFTGGLAAPVLAATGTTVLNFTDPNAPLKVRVVPTGDPDSLRVLWSGIAAAQPEVRWGSQSGIYTGVAAAVTRALPRDALCAAPATGIGWHDLGAVFDATVVGLRPHAGGAVFYVVGDAGSGVFSPEARLWVPLAPGDVSRPTAIVAYQDLGRGSPDDGATWNEYGKPGYNTTQFVALDVAAGPVDAVFHTGDLSYATGYLAVWDAWLDMLAPVASRAAYASGVGNHGKCCDHPCNQLEATALTRRDVALSDT